MCSAGSAVERMSDERMAKKIYHGKASGKRDRGRLRLTFRNSIRDTWGMSRNNHKDPQEMYEEVDDSGRGERGM